LQSFKDGHDVSVNSFNLLHNINALFSPQQQIDISQNKSIVLNVNANFNASQSLNVVGAPSYSALYQNGPPSEYFYPMSHLLGTCEECMRHSKIGYTKYGCEDVCSQSVL